MTAATTRKITAATLESIANRNLDQCGHTTTDEITDAIMRGLAMVATVVEDLGLEFTNAELLVLVRRLTAATWDVAHARQEAEQAEAEVLATTSTEELLECQDNALAEWTWASAEERPEIEAHAAKLGAELERRGVTAPTYTRPEVEDNGLPF